jgi:hypothetical protein
VGDGVIESNGGRQANCETTVDELAAGIHHGSEWLSPFFLPIGGSILSAF